MYLHRVEKLNFEGNVLLDYHCKRSKRSELNFGGKILFETMVGEVSKAS